MEWKEEPVEIDFNVECLPAAQSLLPSYRSCYNSALNYCIHRFIHSREQGMLLNAVILTAVILPRNPLMPSNKRHFKYLVQIQTNIMIKTCYFDA